MKQNKIVVILLAVLLALSLFTLYACKDGEQEQEALNLLISGDIEGYVKTVNLRDAEAGSLSYDDDEGKQAQVSGYMLDKVISLVTPLSEGKEIMITSTDGLAVTIDYQTANLCLIAEAEGKLNLKAPSHPRAAGVKDISEITVIAENPAEGLKIVGEDNTDILGYGSAKLSLYERSAENFKNGIAVRKYEKKDSLPVGAVTGKDKNILYFENYDMAVDEGAGSLDWTNGRLSYKTADTVYKGLIGVVSDAQKVISDAYTDMKSALDGGENVMVILTDGLSFAQIKEFEDGLTLLKSGYSVAASVNPAISNVALASIVTGKSPYHTGITSRGVKKPAAEDIFNYAVSLSKTVKYIEGNGNLIITDIEPVYNLPDAEGYTDQNVYQSALNALNTGADFLFVHFHGIDDVNHDFSPLSSQAEDKIKEVEGYIINLVSNFSGKVIIVPDHGSVTVEENGADVGKHGLFESGDMLVPYYCFDGGQS